MSTCVIGGASGGPGRGLERQSPEPQNPPYGRTDSGPSTPRFKLIVDD